LIRWQPKLPTKFWYNLGFVHVFGPYYTSRLIGVVQQIRKKKKENVIGAEQSKRLLYSIEPICEN